VNRREQIEKEVKKRYGEIESTWGIGFYEGVEWADNNPDRERISKFTDNLIEDNFRLNKLLNEALRALDAILFYGTHNGDGTTTECEMVYLADDALKMIAQMKKEWK
jgi:hypothetical protein